MGDNSTSYHEPVEWVRPETRDLHRAVVSIMEELEAVDWYQQRIDATDDPELAAILAHNRDEEKEHAAMVLEWLRRRDANMNEHLSRYLFTEGDIIGIEHGDDHEHAEPATDDGSLGIGSLRGK